MYFPSKGGHWRPFEGWVVVSVDGACRGNGSSSSNSQGAWGVYFGPTCRFNDCGVLEWGEPHTNSRPELEAVRQALRSVLARCDLTDDISSGDTLVIQTDSDYVAKAFSEHVWRWVDKGWRKTNGQPLAHRDLIEEIQQSICELEQREGIAVRFWRVDRQWNHAADALANQALDDAWVPARGSRYDDDSDDDYYY
jgi:ribonuclease HI